MSMSLNRIKYPLRSITNLSSISHPPILHRSDQRWWFVSSVSFSLVAELVFDIHLLLLCHFIASLLVTFIHMLSEPFGIYAFIPLTMFAFQRSYISNHFSNVLIWTTLIYHIPYSNPILCNEKRIMFGSHQTVCVYPLGIWV